MLDLLLKFKRCMNFNPIYDLKNNKILPKNLLLKYSEKKLGHIKYFKNIVHKTQLKT